MATPIDLIKSLTAARMGIPLSTGKSFTVSLGGLAKLYIIEMEDLNFRHDSAVLLPEQYESSPDEAQDTDQERISGLDVIRTVMIRAQEFPKQKTLIAGHTDTSGKPSYNIKLSEMRGKSVWFMIMNKRDEWAAISEEKHQNKDIQQILTWVNREYPTMDCDPQGIDGKIEGKTHKATKNFQTNFEPEFGRKIKVDGVVGKETWGAFFDVYQRKLASMLEVSESELDKYRKAIKWIDPKKPVVGCGENWPIEEAKKDEYRSRINRRVEILFFDEGEEPRLDCHSSKGKCVEDKCLLYGKDLYDRIYLPVHSHVHPQSIPVIKVPDRPGSTTYIPLHSVQVYVAFYQGDALQMSDSRRYIAIDGKLCNPHTKSPLPIDCGREAWFYCSHRDDLFTTDVPGRFKKDGSGLPLVGPLIIPCGQDVEMQVDIWAQKDWVTVDGVPVDGVRPDDVRMAQWTENYSIGYSGPISPGKIVWSNYTDHREKMNQEKWRDATTIGAKPDPPVSLVNFSKDSNHPYWIGTLSKLPSIKAKLILIHDSPNGTWYVTSFNALAPSGNNIAFTSRHIYDCNLVARLLALPADNIPPTLIDSFPQPPARCLLPGDICWHAQGQTNYCGAFSFAAAMNYWHPYTCNPARKNGAYWHKHVDFVIIPYGARLPGQIVKAAGESDMNARDNNAESLANNNDRARSIKLIKLWIQAGVPVLVLVEESYNFYNLHWKVIVGYDGNRVFYLNSGGDDEYEMSHREPGVNYEKAPVGNDVDSETQLYNKWFASGGDLIDAFSSVDTCTFIPVFPKDNAFAGDTVQ